MNLLTLRIPWLYGTIAYTLVLQSDVKKLDGIYRQCEDLHGKFLDDCGSKLHTTFDGLNLVLTFHPVCLTGLLKID